MIFTVQPTLHTEYDKGFFVLIPALCYLEQYLATIDQSGYTTREAFPEIVSLFLYPTLSKRTLTASVSGGNSV